MEKIFVTPKPGLLVRHEHGPALNPAGETVERTAYWLRRERDGDVTLAPVPVPEPEPLPAAASRAGR